MEEKIILRVAWACTIIGIAGLIAYFQLVSVEKKELFFVNENTIILEGGVSNVRNGKTSFATFKPDEMPMVAFENLGLKNGDRVTIRGKISLYKDRKEIVVDKIIKN